MLYDEDIGCLRAECKETKFTNLTMTTMYCLNYSQSFNKQIKKRGTSKLHIRVNSCGTNIVRNGNCIQNSSEPRVLKIIVSDVH